MSVANFFTGARARRRMYLGPLGPHIDPLINHLQQQGYSRASIRGKVRAAADFSYWLEQHDLHIDDVDPGQQKRFLASRKRLGHRTADEAVAVQQITDLLHEQGLMPAAGNPTALSDQARAVQDFQQYLTHDRGLSAATVRSYLPFISLFLATSFAGGAVRFETLTGTSVTRFVQHRASEQSHSGAQQLIKALRAYLRYLHHQGKVTLDLAACVPTVAAWSLARLPAFLSSEQVERVLAHCDRSTAIGRRDYAIVLLLARLGLRAIEVATLTLEAIDWPNGCLTIRNKGGRWAPMPLPQQVGEAIVDYLLNGRPPCTDRHVFIRDRAPRIGFSSSQPVSAVAARALVRVGIHLPRQGAHLFRHSLATELLRQGASLAEISQLLCHQHPDTTRLYAKVDLSALRELAPPWPGGAS